MVEKPRKDGVSLEKRRHKGKEGHLVQICVAGADPFPSSAMQHPKYFSQ